MNLLIRRDGAVADSLPLVSVARSCWNINCYFLPVSWIVADSSEEYGQKKTDAKASVFFFRIQITESALHGSQLRS